MVDNGAPKLPGRNEVKGYARLIHPTCFIVIRA